MWLIDQQLVFAENEGRLLNPVELAGNQNTVFQFDISARGSFQHLSRRLAMSCVRKPMEILPRLVRLNSTEVVLSDNTEITIDATKFLPLWSFKTGRVHNGRAQRISWTVPTLPSLTPPVISLASLTFGPG